MPQDLFKWEDGAGLKHHCPICQTPLSHEKARTICLGNHVEWCHRYHTLFRKNWSSRCAACKTADEKHEQRHREIAEILAKIKKLKAEEEAADLKSLASPTIPKTPRTPLTVTALNAVSGRNPPLDETLKTKKKERKAAKKAVKALEREKVVNNADIQFVAQALHPGDEQTGKTAESEAEADAVAEGIEVRMNLKYNNNTCNTKSARHDLITQDRSPEKIDDNEVARILDVFEVNGNATNTEGKLVKDLIAAIKTELTCFHDELRMFKKNQAGFWRWANKSAYKDLVENGQEWDAKNRWDHEQAIGDRGDNEAPNGTDTEDEISRTGSIDSDLVGSTGTSVTVPSSRTAPFSSKKAAVLVKPSQAKIDEDGWTQVGKKVLKPVSGKLTLSTNGGLHHLNTRPKGRFGALALPAVSERSDPQLDHRPVVDNPWERFRSAD